MAKEKISNAVISRLPVYYRCLCGLEKLGYTRISSHQLGGKLGFTASQIRQDINCFGGFGQQGYGYNVSGLRMRVGEILGLGKDYRMVVLGAGNIGRAISHYEAFPNMGFCVEAVFDIDPGLIGQSVNGHKVQPMAQLPKFLETHEIEMGVIAVPDVAAQSVCDALVQGGVQAIWNFAPIDLTVPEGVVLKSVHLQDALLVLSYFMSNDMGEQDG